MLRLLKIFPSVKKLVEANELRKDIIARYEKLNEPEPEKQYVTIQPIDRRNEEFIERIGGLWNESNSLKWFLVSIRQDIFSSMLKDTGNAEIYKNQIAGIQIVIKNFEEYERKYEQNKILQAKSS